jgi:hypothetical protein
MPKNETPEEVRRWFSRAIQGLWPVALGSISLRKSPCIRENCSACQAGLGHSSYALAGYLGDERFSIYVPDELAPEIQKAVEKWPTASGADEGGRTPIRARPERREATQIAPVKAADVV